LYQSLYGSYGRAPDAHGAFGREMSFGKMTIGKAGTKYGLHRPNAAAKAKPVASVFGDARRS
jgi:hypothetical protein